MIHKLDDDDEVNYQSASYCRIFLLHCVSNAVFQRVQSPLIPYGITPEGLGLPTALPNSCYVCLIKSRSRGSQVSGGSSTHRRQ